MLSPKYMNLSPSFYLVILDLHKSRISVEKFRKSVDNSRYSLDRAKKTIYCRLAIIKDFEMLEFE